MSKKIITILLVIAAAISMTVYAYGAQSGSAAKNTQSVIEAAERDSKLFELLERFNGECMKILSDYDTHKNLKGTAVIKELLEYLGRNGIKITESEALTCLDLYFVGLTEVDRSVSGAEFADIYEGFLRISFNSSDFDLLYTKIFIEARKSAIKAAFDSKKFDDCLKKYSAELKKSGKDLLSDYTADDIAGALEKSIRETAGNLMQYSTYYFITDRVIAPNFVLTIRMRTLLLSYVKQLNEAMMKNEIFNKNGTQLITNDLMGFASSRGYKLTKTEMEKCVAYIINESLGKHDKAERGKLPIKFLQFEESVKEDIDYASILERTKQSIFRSSIEQILASKDSIKPLDEAAKEFAAHLKENGISVSTEEAKIYVGFMLRDHLEIEQYEAKKLSFYENMEYNAEFRKRYDKNNKSVSEIAESLIAGENGEQVLNAAAENLIKFSVEEGYGFTWNEAMSIISEQLDNYFANAGNG